MLWPLWLVVVGWYMTMMILCQGIMMVLSWSWWYYHIKYWYILVQCGAPKIAKLVYNSKTMVYGTQITIVMGVYKPTYNWGAPHWYYLWCVVSHIFRLLNAKIGPDLALSVKKEASRMSQNRSAWRNDNRWKLKANGSMWQCVKTLVPLVNIKIAGKWMWITH